MKKSDIPFASEFSPSVIDLQQLLELSSDHAGDVKRIESAIRAEWFDERDISISNKKKLAMNVRLGLRSYLLLDTSGNLTEVGRALADATSDSDRYEGFARHILLNLNGAVFVETIRDMQRAGEQVTLNTLRHALAVRGIHTSTANKSMSVLKLWLRKAGIFSGRGYSVNVRLYEDLLGSTTDEVRILADLSRPQRAYVQALAAQVDQSPVNALDVRRLAESAFGGTYDEKQLAKTILYPLRDAGLIALERTGGRAKPFLVTPTERAIDEVTIPLLKQFELTVSPGVLDMIRTPLDEIVAELSSSDRHVKGLALEAFAFRLMMLVGLRHQGTRLSGVQTGGAEVDLVFDSLLLAYSRWQVQCKNTGRVSLDDVAKEVGVAQFMMSSAIVVISTGTVSESARQYARSIMSSSNLAIILLDQSDIARIISNPTAVLDAFEREAQFAFELKPLRLDDAR